MNKKFLKDNIFESDFDSFELDDGFLLKVDAELKKNSLNKKEFGNLKKVFPKEAKKSSAKVKEINKNVEKNCKNYDLPLFIEDLNESDFFDFSKTKSQSSKLKVDDKHKDKKEKDVSFNNGYVNCLSPVLNCKSFNKSILSSSTPLKSNEDLGLKDTQKINGLSNNTPKNSQFDYLEADLFDDWNLDEVNKPETQRETVTLSQALKLIEEAESLQQRESVEAKSLNESVDLITGEIVGADMKDWFTQPFDQLNSVEKKDPTKEKDSSGDSAIVKTNNVKCKPSAAQKLNFGSKNCDSNFHDEKIDFGSVCFSSDDDFDFLTQDLLENVNKNRKCKEPDQSIQVLVNKNTRSEKVFGSSNLNESHEDVVHLKRRKSFNIIKSDTSDDNSSPEFQRKKKTKTRKRTNFEDNSGADFLDIEAEVSEVIISSDEIEEDGEYDRSFVDEESYISQNYSADMTAKYLQSVKSIPRGGTFKIPAAKPYNPENIFSQIPEENNTDYQIDSFCVNDVEEDVKTDLSDLEIAEKILEMDEKKRKKRQKSKKIRNH